MTRTAHELTPLDERLWITETDFQAFGINFGNRMTVLGAGPGRLVLHSPVRASTLFMDTLTQVGEVVCLVCPNRFHYLHLGPWRAHFPRAPVFAPAAQTKIACDQSLAGGPLPDSDNTITVVPIDGCPRLDEYAFVHHPSRTLVLTDLAFNIRHLPGIWAPLLVRLYGAYGHFGPTRLIKALVRDRAAFRASLERILGLDFDRIIVSHGDVVETDGKTLFAEAFSTYLK